jgi:hypothetical protein
VNLFVLILSYKGTCVHMCMNDRVECVQTFLLTLHTMQDDFDYCIYKVSLKGQMVQLSRPNEFIFHVSGMFFSFFSQIIAYFCQVLFFSVLTNCKMISCRSQGFRVFSFLANFKRLSALPTLKYYEMTIVCKRSLQLPWQKRRSRY